MNSPMAIDVARNVLLQPALSAPKPIWIVIMAMYRTILGRHPLGQEMVSA